MSGQGFRVHGPHDHALEHATQGGGDHGDAHSSMTSAIKLEAEKLEVQAKDWDVRSEEQMHQHHRWAQATTALQVAIALATIALLSRKKWLEYGMFVVGGLGALVGLLAFLHLLRPITR